MTNLSFLSWNIEHFNGKGGLDKRNKPKRQQRVEEVITSILSHSPDIFALYEVEGSIVHSSLMSRMSDYSFHITEGNQTQEILVGIRKNIQYFFSQKKTFKRSNPYLRPGALLTVTINDNHYPILFLHLKSMPSPEGFGLRDAMFSKAFDLKKALDKTSKSANKGPSNYIIMGDLNTMGMDYAKSDKDIPSQREIKVITDRFSRRGMKKLSQSHPFTFNNGSQSSYPQTNLDHVYAAKHLEFESQPSGHDIRVAGWAEFDSVDDQDDWIEQYSDHAPLLFSLKIN